LIREFKTVKDWRENIPVYIHFSILGLIFISAPPSLSVTSILGEMPWYVYAMLVIVMGTGALLLKAVLSKKNIQHAFYYTILGILFLGFAIAPVARNPFNQKEARDFAMIDNPSNLPLYAYRMTMPEMVWEYGKILPDLDSMEVNSGHVAPQFLVLECPTCGYNIKRDFRDFNLTLKDSINLNKVEKGHKNYRYRKTARVYLATRK
jgi:hypothetical protein